MSIEAHLWGGCTLEQELSCRSGLVSESSCAQGKHYCEEIEKGIQLVDKSL